MDLGAGGIAEKSKQLRTLEFFNLVAFSTSLAEPTASKLIVLWDDRQIDRQSINLADCRDERGLTTKSDTTGSLLKKCEPDTLYSWGSVDKLSRLKEMARASSWRGKWPVLYTARSAVSTFGYGPIPVRIKLKPGLVFLRIDANHRQAICDGPIAQIERTVFYSSEGFEDWLICSAEVIQSWSYGTKPHYDEIVRDYVAQKGNGEIAYYTIGALLAFRGPPANSWVDHHLFSEDIFFDQLKHLYKIAASNLGEIFFNPDCSTSERTIESHFHTDRPIYFNLK